MIPKLKDTHPELFVGKQKKKKKSEPALISKSIDGKEISVAPYGDNLLIAGRLAMVSGLNLLVLQSPGNMPFMMWECQWCSWDVRSSKPQTRSQSLSAAQDTLGGWL